MVKITKLSDIWSADKIPQYIAESMEKQMLKICKEWKTVDISDFAAFFFVESKADLDNYQETGLTERIETAEPEWMTALVGNGNERCLQICHVIDESMAIYIFCEERYFTPCSVNGQR